MEKRVISLLVLCLSVGLQTKAQKDDFGIWSEVNVEKKINSNWSLDAGAEYRTRDNASEGDRWSVGADLSYKVNKWLKASVGYSLLDDHREKVNDSGKKKTNYWGLRHRVNVSATASKSWGNLGVSLRERWQYTYRPEKTVDREWTYTDDDDDRYEGQFADKHTFAGKGKHVWRNRLQLKYKLSKTWRPYVSAESHVAKRLEKMRYIGGTEIRINKKSSFDLSYLFQRTYGSSDEEGNRHVLCIGYTYNL